MGAGKSRVTISGRQAGDAMANLEKSLDRKLAAIHADPHGCREFILADAKDADMALGSAPRADRPRPHRRGPVQDARRISRADARDHPARARRYHADVGQHEQRAHDRRAIFDELHVTPAVRANDTTDIHLARGSTYAEEPPLFRFGPAASIISSAAISIARPRNAHWARIWPLQRHVQQRPGPRSAHARTCSTVPRRSRAQGISLFPRGLRPQRPRCGRRRQDLAILSQRHDRAHARRRRPGGSAGVLQDGLSRSQGDRGTGPVRPRISSSASSAARPARRATPSSCSHEAQKVRCPGRAVTAERSTTPRTSSPSSSSSG